jgi:carboxypeptidase Q
MALALASSLFLFMAPVGCGSAATPGQSSMMAPGPAPDPGAQGADAPGQESGLTGAGQEAGHDTGQEAGQGPRATPIADEYRDVAARIIAAAVADRGAYEKLTYLTDRIGHRLSGSKALERAVAWARKTMEAEGHDDVRTQKVMVPHWVRGAESARILAPVERELHILGLGGTVGTGRRGVSGEIVIVDDLGKLEAMKDVVAGKIVLFNKAMPPYDPQHGSGYDHVSEYRVDGPSIAARLGARAALVRSLTARSLRSPHTGTLVYDSQAPRIPSAAITTEDAELIARLVAAGETVKVQLTLGARTLPDKESANVIAELRGRERPDEIVLIGAHLDSWDVGQGAHDDGAGCVMVMQALTLLRQLGLRPRRTIRVVLFTNEENGLRGAREYFAAHAAEVDRHVMALEADSGGFAPQGFQFQGSDAALEQLKDIASLLEPIKATMITRGFAGADIMDLARAGVPSLGLDMDGSTYFDYHHSHADTLDKVNPEHLAQDVAAVAVVAYVVADMPARLGGERAAADAP